MSKKKPGVNSVSIKMSSMDEIKKFNQDDEGDVNEGPLEDSSLEYPGRDESPS